MRINVILNQQARSLVESRTHQVLPDPTAETLRTLADRVMRMPQGEERVMLGICGAPGAGKSTLAAGLAGLLGPERAVVVPMDGFHLASSVIRGTPLADRRGAVDTFDVGSYLSLLQRLRARDEECVYAPSYRRGLEDPIAASIVIPRRIPLVITEGNYLLADLPKWRAVRDELDAVWYLDTPSDVRVPRLITRHMQYGRHAAAAAAWALGSDQTNAHLIESRRGAADLIVTLTE
jgi:pantothenate kinase